MQFARIMKYCKIDKKKLKRESPFDKKRKKYLCKQKINCPT